MFYGMYRRLAGWLAEMHSALSDRIPWSKHQNLFRSGNISKLCFGVHSGWLVEPLAVLWSVCGRTGVCECRSLLAVFSVYYCFGMLKLRILAVSIVAKLSVGEPCE